MRSEGERAVSAFGLVLVVGLALAGCRGMLAPEPSEEVPAATGYSLAVRVIPPPGRPLHFAQVSHDNRYRLEYGDSLIRYESETVAADGTVVFDDLVLGPTRISYRWDPPGGEYHDCDWGEVEIPREEFVLDLSRPNLELRTALRSGGQALDHSTVSVRLERSTQTGVRQSRVEAESDSLASTILPGRYRWRTAWYFPSSSPLSLVEVTSTDSISVPGSHVLDVGLDRAWLALYLGGEPLRNVEVGVTTEMPADDRYEQRRVYYRDREWAGDAISFLVDSGPIEVELNQASGTSVFPRRHLWREVVAGDTLHVDLGENRLRLRLRRDGEPVPHARVELHSRRADAGNLGVYVDENGEGTAFLPSGRYGVSLRAPQSLALPVGTSIDVNGDVVVTLEVEER